MCGDRKQATTNNQQSRKCFFGGSMLVTTHHSGSAPQVPHWTALATQRPVTRREEVYRLVLDQTRSFAVSVSPGYNADGAEDVHQRLKSSTQQTQRRLQRKLHVVSLYRLSGTKCKALWAPDPDRPTPTQLGRQQGATNDTPTRPPRHLD